MKNLINRIAMPIVLATLAVGCSEEKSAVSQPPSASEVAVAVSIPDEVFSAAELPNAVSLLQAKKDAKPGETVTFVAAVGGSVDPFVKDRASMTVVDVALPFCAADHGCATPWDACCEAPENIMAHAATVRIADGDGQMLKTGLAGKGGIAAGVQVQVQGTVAEAADGLLVVDASRIHVVSVQ